MTPSTRNRLVQKYAPLARQCVSSWLKKHGWRYRPIRREELLSVAYNTLLKLRKPIPAGWAWFRMTRVMNRFASREMRRLQRNRPLPEDLQYPEPEDYAGDVRLANAVLAGLSDTDRAVVWRSAGLGWSEREIAAEFGMSQRSVGRIKRRAMRQLREEWADDRDNSREAMAA